MENRCVRVSSAIANRLEGRLHHRARAPVAANLQSAPVFGVHDSPEFEGAVAYGLGKDDALFTRLSTEIQRRRDRLAGGWKSWVLGCCRVRRLNFLNIDLGTSPPLPLDLDEVNSAQSIGVRQSLALTAKAGVATIPISEFCIEMPVTNVIRLCFAKQGAMFDEALVRTERMVNSGKSN